MASEPAVIDVGIAASPYPGETVSGDAWHVAQLDNGCRLAVIDGLGHGPSAAAAAAAAVATLETGAGLDPLEALMHCHRALIGTRGAAMLVARIESAAGQFTYAGAGNVEGWLYQRGRCQHLMTDRGIIGGPTPHIRPVVLNLADDWFLLLHSDGVRNRFDAESLLDVPWDAQAIAEMVLTEWGRQTDDATVLVARSSRLPVDTG